MKNITLYAISLSILMFMTLFFPYSHHDLYAKSDFFLIKGALIEAGIVTDGFESWNTIAVFIWSAVISLAVSIPQSNAKAIVSLLLSAGLGIYMILLSIILTTYFSVGGGDYNYTLGIGFYFASIISILFIALSIIHLIKTMHFKKIELDF